MVVENIRNVVVSGGDETVEMWWCLVALHDKSRSHVRVVIKSRGPGIFPGY